MMFIITSGIAEYSGSMVDDDDDSTLPSNLSFKDHSQGILEAGDCFGELVGLGIEEHYNLTVTSWSQAPLEVLVASKEDILAMFSPEVLEELRKRAFQHIVVPRKHKKRKKPKNVVGENGSGVGPFDIDQFMKFEPILSPEEQENSVNSSKSKSLHLLPKSLDPFSFLRNSSSSAQRGSISYDQGSPLSYYPNSPYPTSPKGIMFLSPQRRATTGSALFESESSASFTSENISNNNKKSPSSSTRTNSAPDGHRVRSISHVSIVSAAEMQATMAELHAHATERNKLSPNLSSLYSTPTSQKKKHPPHPHPQPQSQHHHHHHHHNRNKFSGSTTRGGGGEALPKGFSDNVFELLEQVLDEIALVNQRVAQNEETLNALKGTNNARRTSSASFLFNNGGASGGGGGSMIGGGGNPNGSNSNNVNNNIPEASSSQFKMPQIIQPLMHRVRSHSADTNPISPTTNPPMPVSTKVSFTMVMKVEASWLPLHNWQHPYFRLLRPSLSSGLATQSRNITNEVPSSTIVYQSEVSMRAASPSWKSFKITLDNLLENARTRWDETLIFEVWDWNRSRPHVLIGSHHTYLGALRDIKENNTQPMMTAHDVQRSSSAPMPHEFVLHRTDHLEAGRIYVSNSEE